MRGEVTVLAMFLVVEVEGRHSGSGGGGGGGGAVVGSGCIMSLVIEALELLCEL